MRSKLFVPGARPDFFEKALAGAADAISFDLEDSVPADGKADARARVAQCVASDAARGSGKTIIVRVNAADTQHFAADLAALALAGVNLINVPKTDDAASARAAAEAVAAAAHANGLDAPPGLLMNIETPRGLSRAADIASAHPAILGLQVGLNDLFQPLGIARTPANVHAALWTIRLGAGEGGAFAYDGAWPDVGDEAGFRAEAELARDLGYRGKSCIHPKQVALANAVFGRGMSALAEARRLVSAARAAAAQGRGAFLLDGKMVDRPMVARAEALLADAGEKA